MAPDPPPIRNVLTFPSPQREAVDHYLPDPSSPSRTAPFVTLTYACSMDSMIAMTPGKSTPISGPQSKAMTHYLRSKYDAIVVGAGTATADNPTLNSRLDDIASDGLRCQPQPVVLDRNARWSFTPASKMIAAASEGKGKPPWILVDEAKLEHIASSRTEILERCGGRYIGCSRSETVLDVLHRLGMRSIMIEGGAVVINDMLNNHRSNIDSVIVTIAPKLFGRGGVYVSAERKVEDSVESDPVPAVQFTNVCWTALGEDVVMCGNLK